MHWGFDSGCMTARFPESQILFFRVTTRSSSRMAVSGMATIATCSNGLQRPEFWQAKIARNRAVDERTHAALTEAGWRQAVVWECALKGKTRLPLEDVIQSCAEWLRSDQPRLEIRGG